ncbi:protein-glutamine gamma-glutamyltransferase [Peribacillus sp. SI8-4]|uniref:protein-glutamine gamma-glutamyltransferase n=1 Tax=Peribacillus sp. SI8-4 TaxID=3048009 RepID=UPI0025521706|nr:protein-glutamine gamma-glutamyltransferase [Peribacillus sp. SI8-4]
MIKINHKWLDVSQIQPGIPSKALELLQLLAGYATVFEYQSLEELNFEIQLRLRVMDAAISLDKSGAEFATLDESETNHRYWRLAKDGTFTLQPGIPPHLAIADIFQNGRLYAFECGTAIVVTFLRAIMDIIGPRNFDYLFSDLFLYDWHPPTNMALRVHRGTDYIPGDCVYFKNPEHNEKTPEWQGENAILLGKDLFFGHGIGITNSKGIIDELNDNRKLNASISAYLSNHIVSLDSSYYYDTVQPFPGRKEESYRLSSLPESIVAEIGSKLHVS